MRSWSSPYLPGPAGTSVVPRVFDTATGSLVETVPVETVSGHSVSLYVCGITPYDATHLGHAATYLAYDTLVRLWRYAGFTVRYVQNVTDVDDPLLERAALTGLDWRDLATQQVDLFRGDMEALRVIPPEHYIAVTDVIAEVADAVQLLLDRGTAYRVDDDVYFDTSAAASTDWSLGTVSGLGRAVMLELSAERGGDPDRPGKRDALDPLLWRAERPGEPAWNSPVGRGRPGWHIECAVIAEHYAGVPLTVQGGGSDLIFPHHEFTAGHNAALSGDRLSHAFVHTGMVAYQGEKMSKSLGNLVLVSRLVAEGTDPRALRLALLAHHYRDDWEWTPAALTAAEARLRRWIVWAGGVRSGAVGVDSTGGAEVGAARTGAADASTDAATQLQGVLANDLNAPAALELVDSLIAGGTPATTEMLSAVDALLGIDLLGIDLLGIDLLGTNQLVTNQN